MTGHTLRRFAVAWVIALALGSAFPAAAGSYSGRVTVSTVPVPGATVTAIKGDRSLVTTTNELGVFSFADLDDGTWTIKVEMPAFVVVTREVAIAPGGDSTAAAWTLSPKPLEDIARGAAPNALPGPGAATTGAPPVPRPVAPAPPRASGSPAASVQPVAPAPTETSPDASSAAADGYLVNGSVNNGAASPIAQAPAFGNNRRPGASLYSYGLAAVFGNSAFDAQPFAFGGAPAARPDYQNLRINGTFGGPVKFSKSLRKDPIVFLSVQFSSDHNATTQTAVMPTASERAGDFSRSVSATGQPVVVIDPTTGQPFPGNVIPSSRISPEATALLSYYPLPMDLEASGFNFQAPLLNATRQTLVTSRVTQALSTNDQLVGNLAYQHVSTDQTSIFRFTDHSGVSGVDASMVWTHRISQTATWRLRYQFVGLTNTTTPFFAYRQNVSGDAGIRGNAQDPINWGPPSLQFSTITGLTDARAGRTRNSTNSAGGEGAWTRGHHSLTFGGDARRAAIGSLSQVNPRGTFSFNGSLTGSDVADFLLGTPSTSAIAFGNTDKQFRTTAGDAYLADDWRVRPSVSLQVGMRWEYEAPPTERNGQLVNLTVGPNFSTVAPVVGNGSIRPDRLGFQPRIGFAWRPIPNSSLILRGGYGVYRNNGIYQSIASLMADQAPIARSFSVSNSMATPLTLASGFETPVATATNTFGVDPNLRVGLAQNWQFIVQRDLMGFLTLTASYLGTHGSRLLQEFLPNTHPLGAIDPCPTCPTGFVYLTSGGHSSRHAGQWQLRWRLHRGFAASIQYTLASARDDAGAFTGVDLSGNAIAQDWLNLAGEEARSNFDQRHQVVAEAQYTTGMGLGTTALAEGKLGRLINAWTISGRLSTGTGLPFTPVYLVPVSGTGIVGSLRPSLTGVPLEPVAGRYLNPDAYRVPAAGEWGDAGRNSLTGPAPFSFDLSVARAFQLTQRVTMTWRADATNALNRRSYAGVNAIFGGPQFGQPTATTTPRRVLVTMRLGF